MTNYFRFMPFWTISGYSILFYFLCLVFILSQLFHCLISSQFDINSIFHFWPRARFFFCSNSANFTFFRNIWMTYEKRKCSIELDMNGVKVSKVLIGFDSSLNCNRFFKRDKCTPKSTCWFSHTSNENPVTRNICFKNNSQEGDNW